MRLFLSVLEGESAADARPILATADPEILRRVLGAVVERMDPEQVPERLAREARPQLTLVPGGPALVTIGVPVDPATARRWEEACRSNGTRGADLVRRALAFSEIQWAAPNLADEVERQGSEGEAE